MRSPGALLVKNREIIYNYISKYPGVHMCELFRRLNISESTIRYHLMYLERQGLITKQKSKGSSYFFIAETNNSNHKKILKYLRKPTQRNIILYLLVCSMATPKDICKALSKTQSTIKHHIDKLEKDNIIERTPVVNGKIILKYENLREMNYKLNGCKKLYQVTDKYAVYDLFIEHKDKLFDNGLSREMIEFYQVVFTELNKHPELEVDEKTAFDRVGDFILDFMPCPFCC